MSEQHTMPRRERRRPSRRVIAVLGTAAAMATVGLAGTTASAAPPPQTMTVHLGGGPVKASTHDLTAGWTTFDVTSGAVRKTESYAQVFSLRPGVTLAGLESDLSGAGFGSEFTTVLSTETTLYGGVQVENGSMQHFSDDLVAGDYYIADVDQYDRTLLQAFPFTVHPTTTRSHAPASQGSVLERNMRFFPSTSHLPTAGTFTLTNSARNDADDIHFLDMLPVAPGTTDAEIQAYFDHPTGPPTFIEGGPTALSGILSPGHSQLFSYDLPAGTYVLICFITDADTGLPHAAMGMHKVVTLS